jgi:molybdopterin molybdotransferase
LGRILDSVPLMEAQTMGLTRATWHTAADDIAAVVDSPQTDVSLMDGFAVSSRATAQASGKTPVRLRISVDIAAGGKPGAIGGGECARIFTGASIPDGADCVIPVEECEESGGEIGITSAASSGRYVQPAGESVRKCEVVLGKGMLVTPGSAGMLASAGIEHVPVFRKPSVALIAVGDELVKPGAVIGREQTYSSNLVVISGWLSHFGIEHTAEIIEDSRTRISDTVSNAIKRADAAITTGGAGASERDMVSDALEDMGWRGLFGAVKMRPGKGTSFGLLDERPFFCLPGGPTSSDIAFLTLALPGLLRMSGRDSCPFPRAVAQLTERIRGGREGWRVFVYGVHELDKEEGLFVKPLTGKSRLRSMSEATCLIEIAESAGSVEAGTRVAVRLLSAGGTRRSA